MGQEGPEEVIRRKRVAQGLSLAELADRSGVSAAMLSEVERGRKSPTIRILSQIARGLSCTVTDLLGEESLDAPVPMAEVLRSADRNRLVDPETGIVREVLAPLLLRHGIEVLWFTLPAGAATGAFAPHRNGVLEHLTVVRGTLHVTIGGRASALKRGDSMSYAADVEHSFRAGDRSECEYFLIIDSSAVTK